jgi:type IV secretory pathway TrbL component
MIASTVLVVEIEAIFILIGGLFTAPFFAIGYFRDMFLGYIKALASVGVKMLMLCLCLGAVRNIMSTWPGMIASQLENAESVFSFLMPMSCALIGFYMLVKAVPQFASSVMTGSVSGMDGGMVRAAAAAGYGLGMTVLNTSRTAAQKMIGGASVVSQSAQTYMYTSQAAKDTGSTSGEAKKAGAWEAFKTVMTGSQPGGLRAAGDRMYSDHQRGTQFADARSGSANAMSAPDAGSGTNTAGVSGAPVSAKGAANAPAESNPSPASPTTASGAVHSAGPYVSPVSSQARVSSGNVTIANSRPSAGSAKEAQDLYSSSDLEWGSYASDKKKGGEE